MKLMRNVYQEERPDKGQLFRTKVERANLRENPRTEMCPH